MILVDTNALVALIDYSDQLNKQATADFPRLQKRKLYLISPVIAEAVHLLPFKQDRQRLVAFLDEFQFEKCPIHETDELWQETFQWLLRYSEHSPDWADALLAVLSGREKRFRVWTYDSEFKTIWRRPDGSRIPLAVP